MDTYEETRRVLGARFLEALQFMDYAEAGRLLRQDKTIINTKDGDERTPLLNAVRKGDKVAVRYLIANGADVKMTDRDGNSPLYYAAYNTDPEFVRCLLEHGADPNTKGTNDRRALHNAANSGNLGAVESLIAHGAEVDARTVNDRTPLHNAAGRGHLPIVIRLVEAGADPGVTDKFGSTTLSTAIKFSREEVKIYLEGVMGEREKGMAERSDALKVQMRPLPEKPGASIKRKRCIITIGNSFLSQGIKT